MSAKKLKKIAVTIGFKADNTPIKKAFYGRSTAQAKSRAERWLESHGTPEKQADILTLGGWAARWLNVYKKPDVTPTAYTTTYEITVRRHILPALGSCVMMDLTPMDIKAFYNSVSHLSKSVCSKIKMCLNGILETAVENGLCEHNPAHKVKIESTATPRVKEVFSNAEIEIASAWFLQTMPEVVLALETGVRRGELLGFFKSDFDTRQAACLQRRPHRAKTTRTSPGDSRAEVFELSHKSSDGPRSASCGTAAAAISRQSISDSGPGWRADAPGHLEPQAQDGNEPDGAKA